ncbi:MAG TPA: response regulator transcription factor [Oligoflexia bacterium]|nr:response regulator transcription factor [Oligoflexia bacterium]HMR24315.1 response regulator transcription factor [Oligoflexia bacterium]
MNRVRILIVDDEASIRHLLKEHLESNGFEVKEAKDGKEGLCEAIAFRPELILLDLQMPYVDGLTMLRELRAWSQVPVLILTVKDQDVEKVTLLDAGADDYVTKPFSTPELLARIRVALRHARGNMEGPIFCNGPLEVDLEGHIVKMEGKEIHLTSTEFDVLRILCLNAGKVVTQRCLLRDIWGPNLVEHTQYLRVYIRQLRQKLKWNNDKYGELIATEPNVGYRLRLID